MLTRKASLFRNGRNQAVRIPRDFELPGTEAFIRKEGGSLIIDPVRKETLLEVLDRLEPIDEPWPDIDDPPPEPFEL